MTEEAMQPYLTFVGAWNTLQIQLKAVQETLEKIGSMLAHERAAQEEKREVKYVHVEISCFSNPRDGGVTNCTLYYAPRFILLSLQKAMQEEKKRLATEIAALSPPDGVSD